MNALKVFKNSEILITGHTGFKGSWLTALLLELGAKVTGVSKDIPTNPSNFIELGLKDRITHIELDVTNTTELSRITKKIQPDYIFHLAAQPLVRKSVEKPLETWNSNSMGTVSLLESIKKITKKCVVIFITSDKVYKNQEWVWGYRETDLLGGFDPYSASKAAAELAISSYVNTYFNPCGNIKVGIGRAGNVIGGGDWGADRIVPDCVKSWAKSETVQIRNPLSTRPWQHVLEPLIGYLTLASKLTIDRSLHGEAFNFGPLNNNNHSVKDLVLEMSKHWTKVSWEDVSKKNEINTESNLLKLNCDKAKFYLNWQSLWDFETTIKHTSSWYKNFYEQKNCLEFSINQINLYIQQLDDQNQ